MATNLLDFLVNDTRLPEEVRQLYSTLEEFDKDYWFILNMRRTHAHWFSEYDFFFIRPFLESNPEMGEFYCEHSLRPFYQQENNVLLTAKWRVEDFVKEYWKTEGMILVIAWAHESVDKDIALFYQLDENYTVKGLYLVSLNRPEVNDVFIASSLSELFELDKESISYAVKNANGKKVYIPRKPDPLSDFMNVLTKGQFLVLDAEFGFIMNFTFLKGTVYDEYIIPFTAGGLYYDELTDVSTNNETTKIEWKVGDRSWVVAHERNTDYLDYKVFQDLNVIVADLNKTDKRFVVFMQASWGQEFGLAFVSNQDRDRLQKVKSVKIMLG